MKKSCKSIFLVCLCAIAFLLVGFLFTFCITSSQTNPKAQITDLQPSSPSDVGGKYTFTVTFQVVLQGQYSSVDVDHVQTMATTRTSASQHASTFTFSADYETGAVQFMYDLSKYSYDSSSIDSRFSVTADSNNKYVTINFDFTGYIMTTASMTIYLNERTYTVTVASNNASYGTVSTSSFTVTAGASVSANGRTLTVGDTTITATPSQPTQQYTYAFSTWSISSGTITSDTNITAIFLQTTNTYTITANPNNSLYGMVTGGGVYEYGEIATITATPLAGYKFVQWNDGNTNATRTVPVTNNTTYTALFESVNASENTFNWWIVVAVVGGIIVLTIILVCVYRHNHVKRY